MRTTQYLEQLLLAENKPEAGPAEHHTLRTLLRKYIDDAGSSWLGIFPRKRRHHVTTAQALLGLMDNAQLSPLSFKRALDGLDINPKGDFAKLLFVFCHLHHAYANEFTQPLKQAYWDPKKSFKNFRSLAMSQGNDHRYFVNSIGYFADASDPSMHPLLIRTLLTHFAEQEQGGAANIYADALPNLVPHLTPEDCLDLLKSLLSEKMNFVYSAQVTVSYTSSTTRAYLLKKLDKTSDNHTKIIRPLTLYAELEAASLKTEEVIKLLGYPHSGIQTKAFELLELRMQELTPLQRTNLIRNIDKYISEFNIDTNLEKAVSNFIRSIAAFVDEEERSCLIQILRTHLNTETRFLEIVNQPGLDEATRKKELKAADIIDNYEPDHKKTSIIALSEFAAYMSPKECSELVTQLNTIFRYTNSFRLKMTLISAITQLGMRLDPEARRTLIASLLLHSNGMAFFFPQHLGIDPHNAKINKLIVTAISQLKTGLDPESLSALLAERLRILNPSGEPTDSSAKHLDQILKAASETNIDSALVSIIALAQGLSVEERSALREVLYANRSFKYEAQIIETLSKLDKPSAVLDRARHSIDTLYESLGFSRLVKVLLPLSSAMSGQAKIKLVNNMVERLPKSSKVDPDILSTEISELSPEMCLYLLFRIGEHTPSEKDKAPQNWVCVLRLIEDIDKSHQRWAAARATLDETLPVELLGELGGYFGPELNGRSLGC